MIHYGKAKGKHSPHTVDSLYIDETWYYNIVDDMGELICVVCKVIRPNVRESWGHHSISKILRTKRSD